MRVQLPPWLLFDWRGSSAAERRALTPDGDGSTPSPAAYCPDGETDIKSKTAAVGVLAAIKKRLESGISVVVFPEGTTNDGLTIRDFKSTFFKAPIDSKVPILPLSILYSHIDWMPVTPGTVDAVAWHSDMQFVPHFWNLLGFRRIDARIHFNPPLYHFTEDRKTLSSFVSGKVKYGHSLLRLEMDS